VGNQLPPNVFFDEQWDEFADRAAFESAVLPVTLIHVNISDKEIDKVYKADCALVSRRGAI
jgi:hypothetical protein